MCLELTPQGTDVAGSSLSRSLANRPLCILLTQQVLGFVKLSLHLVHPGGLLLYFTLQLCSPEDSSSSLASRKEEAAKRKATLCK